MGLPGVAYLSGVADAGWTAIGLGIGTYLNWLFVAKRLRRYSVKAGNAITIPEFFSNRFRETVIFYWQFPLSGSLSFSYHIQHPDLLPVENYSVPYLTSHIFLP